MLRRFCCRWIVSELHRVRLEIRRFLAIIFRAVAVALSEVGQACLHTTRKERIVSP